VRLTCWGTGVLAVAVVVVITRPLQSLVMAAVVALGDTENGK
jgi:hypothetical protein